MANLAKYNLKVHPMMTMMMMLMLMEMFNSAKISKNTCSIIVDINFI